jgi:hypothetical protein
MGVDDLYSCNPVYLDAYFKLMEEYSKATENFYKMVGASQHLMLTSLSTVSEASLKSLEDSLRQSIQLFAPPAELLRKATIDRMVQDIMSGIQPVDAKEQKELNKIFDAYERAQKTGAKSFKVGSRVFHMAG